MAYTSIATYPENGTMYECAVFESAIEPCAGGYHAPPPTPYKRNGTTFN